MLETRFQKGDVVRVVRVIPWAYHSERRIREEEVDKYEKLVSRTFIITEVSKHEDQGLVSYKLNCSYTITFWEGELEWA